jgi:bile acid:Na+ symporter, BASS family
MEARQGGLARAYEFVHRHFLGLLLAVYVLAAVAPAAGLWARTVALDGGEVLGLPFRVTLPSLLLSALLFNAGLGVQADRLRGVIRNPSVLLAGLLVNLAAPLVFILGMSQTLRAWHNPAEVQCILVGLALVASMPVAGSSTAWSQNAEGDMALSLGLVVSSTCLSPLTTPAVLGAVGWVASGEYADRLHGLVAGGTSSFLVTHVLAPSLLGIGARGVLGEGLLLRAKSVLKLVNAVNVLLLCYANAAIALPQTVADPDWDFLAVTLAIVSALCVLGFASGWVVGHLLRADEARRTSLVFGLGMTNNGTGLVLAAAALADLPRAMLPVIFYNLLQHIVAAATGGVRTEKKTPPPGGTRATAAWQAKAA